MTVIFFMLANLLDVFSAQNLIVTKISIIFVRP